MQTVLSSLANFSELVVVLVEDLEVNFLALLAGIALTPNSALAASREDVEYLLVIVVENREAEVAEVEVINNSSQILFLSFVLSEIHMHHWPITTPVGTGTGFVQFETSYIIIHIGLIFDFEFHSSAFIGKIVT